jgi:hypothetical protein
MLKEDNLEVWVKPLGKGKQKAIALINRGEEENTFLLSLENWVSTRTANSKTCGFTNT